MTFIRVTRRNGTPIYVNAAYIRSVNFYMGDTHIDLQGDDTSLIVQETVDEVLAQLSETPR